MAISDKLTKLNNDLIAAYDAIYAKGAKIPQDRNTNNLASSIGNIPSSGLKPTLYAPTIVVDSKNDKLTITPNSENGSFNNLATYNIYNSDGDLLGNTSDLESTVSDYVKKGLKNTIRVKAISDYFNDSDFSNEESWVRTNGLVITNTSDTDSLIVNIGRLGTGSVRVYILDNSGTTPVWNIWFRSSETSVSDPKTLNPKTSMTIWNEGTYWCLAEDQRTQFSFTGNGTAEISGLASALNNGLNGEWSYSFYKVFTNCTNLVSAENLQMPSKLTGYYNYASMFEGCIGLISAPKTLPATALTAHCYDSMFKGCESLINAPILAGVELAEGCYVQMFEDCISLVDAPELNSTQLAQSCYGYMFNNCQSLATAPTLPATTMADRCYEGMFNRCSGLTTACELPSTNLATACYHTMFSQCTSLVTYPYALTASGELPEDCYRQMFQACTSLTSGPTTLGTALSSVKKLGISSCQQMFAGCTALTSATSFACDNGIAENGALQMYSGCSSLRVGIDQQVQGKILTRTPTSTRLGADAVTEMFNGCLIHGTVTWVDGTPNPEELIFYYAS